MMFGKEKQPLPEISPELVNALIRVFINRSDVYARQQENGAYTCVKRPLTTYLVAAHLGGSLTLGAYALDADSRAKWLCLDADSASTWDELQQVARDLTGEGIYPYLETSRRGGHLWLFTPPMSGAIIRSFARAILKPYNLDEIEIYPKQDHVRSGVGSLVRLPFGVHRKTGRRYSFVTSEGVPLAPTLRQQIELMVEPQLLPLNFINAVLDTSALDEPPSPVSSVGRYKGQPLGITPSERVKNAISVHDFVSRYVTLDVRGKGLCPFHDDQVQSFQVNLENNYWSCYAGCGGGSIIDFWMHWRHLHGQDSSFKATLKDLVTLLL